jgi:hypothetical protein
VSEELLARIESVVETIVDSDLPELGDGEREQLVGHLAGALYVIAAREREAAS